jgi:hypothetical protein
MSMPRLSAKALSFIDTAIISSFVMPQYAGSDLDGMCCARAGPHAMKYRSSSLVTVRCTRSVWDGSFIQILTQNTSIIDHKSLAAISTTANNVFHICPLRVGCGLSPPAGTDPKRTLAAGRLAVCFPGIYSIGHRRALACRGLLGGRDPFGLKSRAQEQLITRKLLLT